jgi:hypothetical protein
MTQRPHPPLPLFRVPHGWYGPQVISTAEELGFRCVGWSVIAWDWDRPAVGRHPAPHPARPSPRRRLLAARRSGHRCLFPRADRSHTIAAVPRIVRTLKADGFGFLTLPVLVDLDARDSRPQTRIRCGPPPLSRDAVAGAGLNPKARAWTRPPRPSGPNQPMPPSARRRGLRWSLQEAARAVGPWHVATAITSRDGAAVSMLNRPTYAWGRRSWARGGSAYLVLLCENGSLDLATCASREL